MLNEILAKFLRNIIYKDSLMSTKVCTKCKIEKDVSYFCKSKKTKDKLDCWCKKCKNKQKLIKKYGSLEKYKKILNKKEKLLNNNKKICSKCGEIKDLSYFSTHKSEKDGLRCWCKKCSNKYNKKHYTYNTNNYIMKKYGSLENYQEKLKAKERLLKQEQKNRQKILDQKTRLKINNRKICITCKVEKNTSEFNRYKNKLRSECKKCRRRRQKEYRAIHKEQRNAYERKKYKLNTKYKINIWLSRALGSDLKKRGSSKYRSSAWEFVDYTKNEFIKHIESLWEPWMNWDNHGKASKERRTWNIDHIIPKSNFDYQLPNDYEVKKCWALENLRPLEAFENLRKSNKVIEI